MRRWQQVGAAVLALGLASFPAAASPGDVIEEIIAHVNDRIIVLSEYNRSLAALRQELQQSGATGLDLEARFREQAQHVLRDLIDHELLVQKAAELGLNADTEVIKRLDEIRQNMNLPSMEALEEAVVQQGLVYEDFKQNLRDSFLTQWVIQREVGSRVQVTPEEIRTYYEQHQEELRQPAGVSLQQILISTEGKPAEELPALRRKAEEALAKAKAGEDFAQLARQYSDDASASQGGNAGFFEDGSLSPEIERAIAPLQKGQISDLVETRYGFMIFKLLSRTQAGVPPLAEAESRIHERLYLERIQPAMREYLRQLRQESYISVKPGYIDTGAAPAAPPAASAR
ncbi:MAG TPA: peptidyl-prolyl cis-trans isomerase [Terriglobia bacterium]|nr:peptidyl-prolyl cis-trans isomerase [Terriglobia bacterium]